MDHRKELERLKALEYGKPLEFVSRLLVAGAGAAIHYSYTGMIIALIWFAGFLAAHLAYYITLRTRPRNCTVRDTQQAGSMALVMLMAYIWLPALLTASDDVALRIAGMAGTATLLIYLIHRADRMKWMVCGEIAIVAFAVGGVTVLQLHAVSDRAAQGVIAFATLVVMTFFARTMLEQRRTRLETEAAATRSIQAQKMEAVSQLAGGVAHDFNNILTTVTGNLDLYHELDNPAERDRCLKEAHDAADRAAKLVRQLVAYSRKSTLNVADHDLSQIFDQIRALSLPLLPETTVLTVRTPPADLHLRIDRNRLITAALNLIVNGRDAMKGIGRLTLGAEVQDLKGPIPIQDGTTIGPGKYICLTVEDNGPGIPRNIRRRVTEPFFTTKAIGEGSGLGLSMAEGFARQSGGGLAIETSGAGTRVKIFLPCPAPRRQSVADNTRQGDLGITALAAVG